MLDVLLVKIQPTDVVIYNHPDDFEFFSSKDSPDFEVCVSNGEKLQFTVSKVRYSGSNTFFRKETEIHKRLNIDCGGHAIAIDKYPASQFRGGAERVDPRNSGVDRHEVECCSEDFSYDSVVLLIPDLEPIILSDLNFACYTTSGSGSCSRFINFEKEAVLSFKSPLGEVIGIALQHQNKSALHPDSSTLSYNMSFEKVSLPAVILQKLLETKPQLEGKPHEETNE